MTRRQAREKAFALLFQAFEGKCSPEETLQEWLGEEEDAPQGPQVGFIRTILEGCREHQDKLDEIIRTHLVGWDFDRLLSTDKHLLRMSLFELLYTDIPPPVLINEAVLLARKFGSDQSGNFINGLLGRVTRERSGT